MELNLKVHETLCSTYIFCVNGITADTDDFGTQCEDVTTPNRLHFTRIPPTMPILTKYKITISDYREVAKRLEDALAGNCRWR